MTDLLSIQPDPALPDHPLQKESDAFSLPLFRDLDGPAVPGRADIGKLARKSRKTGLADFRFGPARGAESGLIRGAGKGNRLRKTYLGIGPILTDSQIFGVEADLPSPSEGLSFGAHEGMGHAQCKEREKSGNPHFHRTDGKLILI